MGGYVGKILEVDLSTGVMKDLVLPAELQRQYVGGSGLAARLFFERRKWDVDPLGPDNDLFILTGPLGGTLVPGAARFAVSARSPLTKIWGEGSCGGSFAPELKRCGYDGVIAVGQSPRPVMLVLDGGKVELRDAASYWGLDNYAIVDRLVQELGGKRKPSVLSIGQAGENLVAYANMACNKADYVGRTGMGAVMGSKKLKAIVARGSGDIPIADPVKYKALFREIVKDVIDAVPSQSLQEMGTDAAMDLGMMLGDIPIRNWTRGEDFEMASNLGGPSLTEHFLKKTAACPGCPISCRRVVEIADGPYQTALGPGPEFETCAAFGTMLDQKDLAAVVKANEWCGRYGVDTISCGSTIAWAYECFEKGLLTLADTDGIELKYGSADPAIALLHKIARREGIGELLACGSREASRRLGRGSEDLTAEIKGLEIPMHDPRASHGLALAYMTSYRGACHKAHLVEAIEHGFTVYQGVGLKENYDGPTSVGKAQMVRIGEDIGVPLNALCLCEFDTYGMQLDELAQSIAAITGWEGYDLAEYVRTGERLWLLKRCLNNLMGVTRADDRLPLKVRTPVPDGAAKGIVPDQELLLNDYYAERGLDERGRPLPEVLRKAGLADVAEVLFASA